MDPLLTHLSLVGSLAFFFATAQFRERVPDQRRLGITSPDAAQHVKHIQGLITHGLTADWSGSRRAVGVGRAASAPPRPPRRPAGRDHGARKERGR